MQPLKDVLVIDLTRAVAGPVSTMILADFGAQIIKIEPPQGDDSRTWGPYVNGESAFYMSINRGKKSIVMDLKKPQAQSFIRDLVRKADVIVENYRPGIMEKFGLDYESLNKINPQIIYACISGFGHTGPFKMKPAWDMIVQAMGGIMSITGSEGGTPTRVGPSISDLASGIYSALGIIMALYARTITGKGQKVDVAMLDCIVALLENAIARYLYSGKMPRPVGNRHSMIAPFQAYQTSDSWIIISVGNQKQWLTFCELLGRADLISDEKFLTNVSRVNNLDALNNVLEPILKSKMADEWIESLESVGIACSKVNNVEQVVNHPQVVARDMIIELDHPTAGRVRASGIPVKLSATPGEAMMPAPLLGEHTNEIMKDLFGLDEMAVSQLKASGVLS